MHVKACTTLGCFTCFSRPFALALWVGPNFPATAAITSSLLSSLNKQSWSRLLTDSLLPLLSSSSLLGVREVSSSLESLGRKSCAMFEIKLCRKAGGFGGVSWPSCGDIWAKSLTDRLVPEDTAGCPAVRWLCVWLCCCTLYLLAMWCKHQACQNSGETHVR